jgi:GAF domain-containing protein
MLDRVLERTLDRARDLIGAEAGTVRLLSADGQLRVAAMFGEPEARAQLGGVALATRVGLAQEPLLLPGASGRHDPDRGLVLGAPIVFADQLLGVIQLGAPAREPFGAMDIEIIDAFTRRIALALNHSRLYEDALVALEGARAPV